MILLYHILIKEGGIKDKHVIIKKVEHR
jgi:hypothetical protein